jgi:hypothetical protein
VKSILLQINQLQAAETGIQGSVAVAVAVGRALAGALVPPCADQALHIGLHQQLHHVFGHAPEEIAVAGFGQQLGKR